MNVVLDACVLIYGVESTTALGRRAEAFLESRDSPATSAISELECRVLPYRSANPTLLARYEELFARVVRVVPVSNPVLLRAARLRAEIPGLKTPDAIHAATALELGAEFVTADPGFRRVPGLAVRLL